MPKVRAAIIGATGLAGQQFVAGLADHPWIEDRGSTATASCRTVQAVEI